MWSKGCGGMMAIVSKMGEDDSNNGEDDECSEFMGVRSRIGTPKF